MRGQTTIEGGVYIDNLSIREYSIHTFPYAVIVVGIFL